MKDRLRQILWWRWIPVGVLLAAAIYALSLDGVLPLVIGAAAVLTTLATIASAVLEVWNPFEPRPKPHLTLRPLDGEATTSLAIGTEWHEVDVEAVVENAREAALSVKPSSIGRMTGRYAAPTEADHEKYKSDVEVYVEDVRTWAQGAATWLRDRALVLDADVIQRNPTSVDADDAEIFVTFPAGTEEYEDETDPPEAPERPHFPVTLTPAARMLAGESLIGFDSRMRGLFPTTRTDVVERLADLQQEVSWGTPSFEQQRDGTLQLSYGRQTVRHRQEVPSGDSFSVRLPAGEHEVRWRVHSPKLPHHAEGTWRLSCPDGPTREPIDNVYDLEAALRGEPIRDFDLSSLFSKQADGADNKDRNDSSTDPL